MESSPSEAQTGHGISITSRALLGESRDSGFKFQNGKILDSKFKIQIFLYFWHSNFKPLFWDSFFKHAGILDSNLKLMGFRIQIWAYRALLVMEPHPIKAIINGLRMKVRDDIKISQGLPPKLLTPPGCSTIQVSDMCVHTYQGMGVPTG